MENTSRTMPEMIKEITALKQKIKELEQSENEHKREEEELRFSRQQLRLLIDAGPYFFFLKDLNLRYQLVNSANARFFERAEFDILGRTDDELMDDGAAASCQESDRLAIREKRIVITTELVGNKYYETYKFPVIVADKVIGVAGIIRDITDRKRTEEELHKNRRFLSDLIEHSGALICVKDCEGRYELVNRKWEEVTGLERQDVVGRTDEEIFPGETGKQFRQNDLEVMESGLVLEKEESLEDEDGKRFFISIKFPLRSDDETIRGICGMFTEITSRKLVEEELHINKDRLSRAEIISHSGNWQFDMKSKRAFASDGARRIYGITKNEMSIMEVQKIPLQEYRGMLDNALHGLIMENFPYDVEFKVKLPDTGKIVDIHSVAEYDRQNEVVFGIIQDITDRKFLELQLLQAQKLEAIGTLAGGIAHDFNNLLMGIRGYASLMLMDLDPFHPHYEKLKRIENQVQSGADLTRQLLGFARGGKYAVKPVNMNELIEKTSTMFGRTKKEIAIYRKYENNIWVVEVDQGQIEQVLLNLYLNAWQAMPKGGDISIETKNVVIGEHFVKPYLMMPGRYVRTSIRDTGVGMDEKTRDRIFEPFFTTKELGRGTGLGLAMVYGIVKSHNGFIDVISEPGKGTEFIIYFNASERGVVKEKPVAPEIMRGTETILIVDDEPDVLEVSKGILEFLGYTVHGMGSGNEAIAFYKEKKDNIALIILDMIMPKLSGSETFDRIRELNPSARIILSSGYSLNDQAQQIMDKGCHGFIQKPFNIANISRIIREILDL